MKIYKNSGDVVTITAAQAITSGDFVKVGALQGFAQSNAEADAAVVIVTRGVFEAGVYTADAGVEVGQKIYANFNEQPSTDETGDYIGYAVTTAAAVDGVATVNIRLA